MPLHHLHDGPLPSFIKANQAPPPRTRPVSIAALQWAAERANTSYGRFILNLSTDEQQRIQAEFEAFQGEQKRVVAERQAARQAVSQPRVNNDQGGDEGYIINDEDA